MAAVPAVNRRNWQRDRQQKLEAAAKRRTTAEKGRGQQLQELAAAATWSSLPWTIRLSLGHLISPPQHIPSPPIPNKLGPHVRQPRLPPRLVQHFLGLAQKYVFFGGKKSLLRTDV